MTREIDYCLRPIGVVRSSLKERSGAPRQGDEGAPDVWLEMAPEVAEGLEGIELDADILVVTWLHQGRRDVLKVHPRGNKNVLSGVFATRSPDRPNPLGLHRVTVRRVVGRRLRIGPKLTVHILERDIRCRMIGIDPETLEENPEILRYVAKNHDNTAGVYAAVLVEGLVRPGDDIVLLD